MTKRLNRREFLKLSVLGAGSLFLNPIAQLGSKNPAGFAATSIPINGFLAQSTLDTLDTFPQAERLARIVDGKIDIKARPDINSENVGVLFENAVVPWIKEVVGTNPFRFVQRFIETPQGYIWSPHIQHCANTPDENPRQEMPSYADGNGFWVEVMVPFVDLVIENPPVRSPAFREGVPQRLYYKQVIWVDNLRVDDGGNVWYRINERFGTYGDIFWAPGKAFHVIAPDELTPINPDAEEKLLRIRIHEDIQTLSCLEGNREVYFCRVSAGKRVALDGSFIDRSSTPLGNFPTWRKLYSIHMSGGASGVGWDLIGVAWATFFAVPGIAIHSTFWHNNFGGEYMSRGCINVLPDDAKWIFRWMNPFVPYDVGDLTVQMPGGTRVQVVD